DKIIDLGLSIELIHIATLIHDDVNDRSELRRGVDTYNKKWGNSSSVLFGDFLFCRAFVILAQMGNLQIIQNLSKTTSEICEGEIMQSFLKKNYEISIDKYFQIIRYKTASLIAESCRVGAIITDQDKETQECLYRFGLNLGMAFQIYDDFLDFHGNEELLGKPVLNDVVNGYITLPLIHLFNQKENGNREQIYNEIEEMQRDNNLHAIIELLEKSGSLDYSLNKAKSYVNQAQKELEPLNNDKLKNSLLEVAQFIINREF
ncbi:MAG: polyprenyl synthetase family protein, partial [Spirochaetota bacterium]|nr:polyprenyl synthetase family protein [Spirochaetota bacterium]